MIKDDNHATINTGFCLSLEGVNLPAVTIHGPSQLVSIFSMYMFIYYNTTYIVIHILQYIYYNTTCTTLLYGGLLQNVCYNR